MELGRATRSVHYRPLLSTDDLTWGEKAGFGSGDEMAVREAQVGILFYFHGFVSKT